MESPFAFEDWPAYLKYNILEPTLLVLTERKVTYSREAVEKLFSQLNQLEPSNFYTPLAINKNQYPITEDLYTVLFDGLSVESTVTSLEADFQTKLTVLNETDFSLFNKALEDANRTQTLFQHSVITIQGNQLYEMSDMHCRVEFTQ